MLQQYQVFTQEVPDENVLKKSWWFETVLKNLLQSPDQSILSTEKKSQAASLWRNQYMKEKHTYTN